MRSELYVVNDINCSGFHDGYVRKRRRPDQYHGAGYIEGQQILRAFADAGADRFAQHSFYCADPRLDLA